MTSSFLSRGNPNNLDNTDFKNGSFTISVTVCDNTGTLSAGERIRIVTDNQVKTRYMTVVLSTTISYNITHFVQLFQIFWTNSSNIDTLSQTIPGNCYEKKFFYICFNGSKYMTGKRAYLFDFDGTLVDTMQGFADIAADVISAHHPEISFDEARREYLRTSGNPFFKQLEMILPGYSLNYKMSEIFEERKVDGFFKSTFSDDVRCTIESLRSRGDIAGVASNNFQELIDRFVEREGLAFDVVLGFREGFEKGKDHFDYVIDRFSLERGDLTFVGDSLKDAEKAFENNIKFIGVCGTFRRDDFLRIRNDIITIHSLKEILTL